VLTFAEDTVDLATAGKGGDQRIREVSEMSLHELLHPDPTQIPERDFGKLAVEAHHRLTQPITSVAFALVAVASVLTGGFRRHGNLARPAAAVGMLVGLLAAALAVSSLATRNMALLPLIWLEAILPGVAAAWILFAPNAAERAWPRAARQVASPNSGG
jgi:lipopolysaccharide export system permease protein